MATRVRALRKQGTAPAITVKLGKARTAVAPWAPAPASQLCGRRPSRAVILHTIVHSPKPVFLFFNRKK